MPKYRLAHRPIRWPDKCAECGAPATTSATAKCSVVTKAGYFVMFVKTTHLTATVDYPVCKRHSFTARLAGTISSRNLVNLFLGALWVYAGIGTLAAIYRVVLLKDSAPLGALPWISGVFAIGLIAMLLARRFTPVKLNAATEETLTCSIRSEDYAAEFERLNSQQVIATIPWWKS